LIGPVQLMMIGYQESRIAAPLREKVAALKSDPAIRVIDVLCVHKNDDGSVETEPVADLLPENSHEPGTIIDRLLTKAEAARTLNQNPRTGPGYLFHGDVIPDFRLTIPDRSGVLALLIEHRWAAELRDTAAAEGAYPVDDGWMGHDALRDVHLIANDSGPAASGGR
jgi:hypothetical protein